MGNDYLKLLKRSIKQSINKLTFKSSKYWEKRYKYCGNSGSGSYNKIAEYKGEIINNFINTNHINKMVDYGCGDGNQITYFQVNNYFGIDFSKTAIEICLRKFADDKSKNFNYYSHENDQKNKIISFDAELCISLDVIYHLVEDSIFKEYMNNLFSFSNKYVIIFSTNYNETSDIHHKNRKFTTYIDEVFLNWSLIKIIKNPYKGTESLADFYFYETNR